MFNVLLILHFYLFVMCKNFHKNNYLFMLLKYLFLVAKTNYLVLNDIFLKIVQT